MALEINYSGQVVEAVQAHGTVTVRAPSNTIGVSTGILGGGGMPYAGPYEVTPGREAQVLPTEARTLAQDVVVNPIPHNYGLITYNGSTITVS